MLHQEERRGKRGRREEILQENELRTEIENKAERDEQGGKGRL